MYYNDFNEFDNMEWSSSDETIAKVFMNGLVYAVAPGKATITVKIGGKSAKCTVTVEAAKE